MKPEVLRLIDNDLVARHFKRVRIETNRSDATRSCIGRRHPEILRMALLAAAQIARSVQSTISAVTVAKAVSSARMKAVLPAPPATGEAAEKIF